MPKGMKNINTRIKRGHSEDSTAADDSMVCIEILTKKGLRLIKVKVLFDEFCDSKVYRVIVDNEKFVDVSYIDDEEDVEYFKREDLS